MKVLLITDNARVIFCSRGNFSIPFALLAELTVWHVDLLSVGLYVKVSLQPRVLAYVHDRRAVISIKLTTLTKGARVVLARCHQALLLL